MNIYQSICKDLNTDVQIGRRKKLKFLPLFLFFRYASAPLPGKENLLRFWLMVSQPVFRKMSFGVLIQVLTGLYLATKHHGIYIKILENMNPSRDPEELQD